MPAYGRVVAAAVTVALEFVHCLGVGERDGRNRHGCGNYFCHDCALIKTLHIALHIVQCLPAIGKSHQNNNYVLK